MFGAQLHNGVPYNPSIPKKVWRKVRKTIVVDSRDRQMNGGSHAGDYTVTLPTVYQNVYAATLKSIEMPLSFYQFSAQANNVSLLFSYGSYGVPVPLVMTIPDGNYTESQMEAAINAGFDAALSGSAPAGSVTVTFSPITGKCQFATNDVLTLYLAPPVPTSANCGSSLTTVYTTWWGLGYFLGFTPTTHMSPAPPLGSSSATITANFAFNLFPINYVLLDLGVLNKIDETCLDDRKGSRVNGVFAKIPCDGNSGDYIYLTDTGAYPLNRTVFTPPVSKLTTLNIKFRLHDGRVIDFNGVENSFTLELELLDNNFDEFSSVEFSV
jgi:hypothetical protein